MQKLFVFNVSSIDDISSHVWSLEGQNLEWCDGIRWEDMKGVINN
jgi:hypothetical protein